MAIILAAFVAKPVLTLRELAEHCPSGNEDHTSWARNSLRKPCRHGLIAKVGRGRYEVTPNLATFDVKKLAAIRRQTFLRPEDTSCVSQEHVKAIIGARSRQRVSDLERGAKRPTLTEVYALADALRVKLACFFPVVAVEEEVVEVVAEVA